MIAHLKNSKFICVGFGKYIFLKNEVRKFKIPNLCRWSFNNKLRNNLNFPKDFLLWMLDSSYVPLIHS